MLGVRRLLFAWCTATTLATAHVSHAAAPEAPSSPIPATAQQLLLVRAPSWFSASGTLQRYEREKTSAWRATGGVVHVSLGRHGMAWGRGLHQSGKVGPLKREGDGRSPAGVFALKSAFGSAEALPSGARGFPYQQATPSTYCVEDTRSSHYNEIIDATELKPVAWQRWSPLRRSDGLFRWAVVVRQNSPGAMIGAGSCVFLHIWRGERQPTSGCTAMPPEAIEAILRWLDPKAEPVLVQLPEPVYRSVSHDWALPADEDVKGK